MTRKSALAGLIEAKSMEMSRIIDSPVTTDRPLVAQSRELIEGDQKTLQRFGANFQIPDRSQLDPHLKVEFNHFLVEQLLRDGSLLLDRCLTQKREFEELRTKWFEARVQIDELIRLNQIAAREEEEHYELPEQIAHWDSEAMLRESEQVDESLRVIREQYPANFNSVTEQLGTYEAEGASNMAKANDFRAAAQIRAGRERIPVRIQESQQEGLKKILSERLKGIKLTVELKKRLADFQRDRNDVARLTALRRAEQLLQPLGALNFFEQMQPIRERLENDFIAAWLRLSSAAKGLDRLYQYPIQQFPTLSPGGRVDFDQLVTWCQYTNTWLASFLDTQQLVTRSFSLRQLLTEMGSNFEAGARDGRWRFRLKEKHFSDALFVRLRSFALQVDSGHAKGSWNVAIAPPTKAIIRQRNGRVVNVEQGQVGTLYLGRVNERTYAVIPESSAPPKLFNALPIGEDNLSGEWGVEVQGYSTTGIPTSSILDIDLHLTVALV